MDIVVGLVSIAIIGLIIGLVIIAVANIYYAFVEFKKPEYYCSNCGKRLKRRVAKCPKCKSIFTSESKIGEVITK